MSDIKVELERMQELLETLKDLQGKLSLTLRYTVNEYIERRHNPEPQLLEVQKELQAIHNRIEESQSSPISV